MPETIKKTNNGLIQGLLMNKINYDKQFDNIVKAFDGKKRLLLHACCAPCSSSVLERVTPFFDVTLFFYNPNITDEKEYYKRLAELERFVGVVYGDSVKIEDGVFDPQTFLIAAKGLENEPERGKRCTVCYYQRLEKTAYKLINGGFDYFCTTLTLSPHKDAERINNIGAALEKSTGAKYRPADFKKQNGYIRSIELSTEYGLYRQNYCGCEYSQMRNYNKD